MSLFALRFAAWLWAQSNVQYVYRRIGTIDPVQVGGASFAYVELR